MAYLPRLTPVGQDFQIEETPDLTAMEKQKKALQYSRIVMQRENSLKAAKQIKQEPITPDSSMLSQIAGSSDIDEELPMDTSILAGAMTTVKPEGLDTSTLDLGADTTILEFRLKLNA